MALSLATLFPFDRAALSPESALSPGSRADFLASTNLRRQLITTPQAAPTQYTARLTASDGLAHPVSAVAVLGASLSGMAQVRGLNQAAEQLFSQQIALSLGTAVLVLSQTHAAVSTVEVAFPAQAAGQRMQVAAVLAADLEPLAARTVEARIASGAEELVPAHVADRLIDRESPLRVWREYRGLSQSALACASGVNRVQIVEIETGRNSGSVYTLRKLADVLEVAVDDIIPA
ncbi:MAG: helix-turn-helix transcriptional regulator [Gemmatimonadetes bacterium]|nr:helix-turn-helix transcriptional regulator [Gemmatimonadota bacterium]